MEQICNKDLKKMKFKFNFNEKKIYILKRLDIYVTQIIVDCIEQRCFKIHLKSIALKKKVEWMSKQLLDEVKEISDIYPRQRCSNVILTSIKFEWCFKRLLVRGKWHVPQKTLYQHLKHGNFYCNRGVKKTLF